LIRAMKNYVCSKRVFGNYKNVFGFQPEKIRGDET